MAHIRMEIAALEAQLTAVCGEAARLVGSGKTPASQVSYGCALYLGCLAILDTHRFSMCLCRFHVIVKQED